MRRMQRKRAAMQTASSTRVHTSVMRISRVGKRALGRMSHQSFVPSSMSPTWTSVAMWRRYSA
jgi:hypothetical protein